MIPAVQIIIALLTALGLGSALGAYFQSLFQHKKQIKEQEHGLKSKRYGAIIMQMITVLNPEFGLPKIKQFRPDLKTVDDVKQEIATEFLNSLVYANDEVIKSLGEFNNNPNFQKYIKVVVSMRKDLWGKKTSINERTLEASMQEGKAFLPL